MSITTRMHRILNQSPLRPTTENEDVEPRARETQLWQALSSAAASLYDIDDDASLDKFVADVKVAVSKDKAKLRAFLRRYTRARARTDLRTAGRSV